ncbi:MAG: DUF1189 family protein [Gammaproteobacteria bacterium]|nr:DUF1189 family protein [Gammaproteobacteria bacterium]
MSHFNVFQALYLSFTSKALYRDVAKRWGAKVFLYLLFLVALSWVPSIFQMQQVGNAAYKRNADQIVNQVPVITVANGKIKTPENRPYLIVDPENKQNIAVIDTSGTYKTLEQANAGILITETQLISKPRTNETRFYQLPATLNITVVPKTINQYVQTYLWVVWIFLFFIFTIGSYIYHLVQSLLYAVLGKIMAKIAHVTLTYEEILQITLVAITPAIILSTVFDFFNIIFNYRALFFFLLTLAYLYFGIAANKTSADKVSTPSP